LVIIKSPREIEKIYQACQIVAEILQRLKEVVEPGITTWDLNALSDQLAAKRNAKPAFNGYQGYPFSLCTSVNEEVVHGMPSKSRRLLEGEIVSIDFGVIHDGYYGDAAITVPVGRISEKAAFLCEVAEQSLYQGIKQAVAGNRLSDISHAIQTHVEARKFSVVREFVGHGIGQSLHESPQIPNYGPPGKGIRLKAGMVLAIEPMINEGRAEVEIQADQWTAVTVDRKLSAHFEHTVVITENGPEILSALETKVYKYSLLG
jgi:methionyl aminopeptidase